MDNFLLLFWISVLTISSMLSIFISAYGFVKSGKISGAKLFSIMMLTTAFYCQTYAFEILSTSTEVILYHMKWEGFWAGLTATSYFLFVVQFTRRIKLNKSLIILTIIISLFFGLTFLTLENHNYIYKNYELILDRPFPVIVFEPGILYIINAFYLIIISLISIVILLLNFLKSKGLIQKQSITILLAGLLPTIIAILFPAKSQDTHINYQPFSLVLSGILICIALYKYQILDLTTIARWFAVDNIVEYMIILDTDMNVIDINRSGRESELFNNIHIGNKLPNNNEPYITIKKLTATNPPKIENINSKFIFNHKHYNMNISQVIDKRGNFRGYVIIVNDITTNVNLMMELENKAIHDGLTNIYNRRHFISLAERELKILKRNNQFLTLIMLDIDHFKKINDTYGHLKGDEVLTKTVNEIKHQLRPTDIFGRYGGEEFCILLPSTGGIEAQKISERLRKSVSELTFQCKNEDFNITVSLGLYAPKSKNETMTTIINNADKALYIAKDQGRNRTVIL